jgi:hypothetical protein
MPEWIPQPYADFGSTLACEKLKEPHALTEVILAVDFSMRVDG